MPQPLGHPGWSNEVLMGARASWLAVACKPSLARGDGKVEDLIQPVVSPTQGPVQLGPSASDRRHSSHCRAVQRVRHGRDVFSKPVRQLPSGVLKSRAFTGTAAATGLLSLGSLLPFQQISVTTTKLADKSLA